MTEEQTREISEETEEVEELVSNRLLDSLNEINSVAEILTREEIVAEDLTASATLTGGVDNAARSARMRVVTVGGKVDALIGGKPTGRQVDGRETPYSNHLTWKQRKKGEIFYSNFLPSNE